MKATLKNYFQEKSLEWTFYIFLSVLFLGSFFLSNYFNFAKTIFRGKISEDWAYGITAMFSLILSGLLTPIIIEIRINNLKNKYRNLH